MAERPGSRRRRVGFAPTAIHCAGASDRRRREREAFDRRRAGPRRAPSCRRALREGDHVIAEARSKRRRINQHTSRDRRRSNRDAASSRRRRDREADCLPRASRTTSRKPLKLELERALAERGHAIVAATSSSSVARRRCGASSMTSRREHPLNGAVQSARPMRNLSGRSRPRSPARSRSRGVRRRRAPTGCAGRRREREERLLVGTGTHAPTISVADITRKSRFGALFAFARCFGGFLDLLWTGLADLRSLFDNFLTARRENGFECFDAVVRRL